MTIGYKRIPVTGMARGGTITVSVHTTYVILSGKLEIWEATIHPTILQVHMDHVDQMNFVTRAQKRLLETVKPTIKERSWEGVLYG